MIFGQFFGCWYICRAILSTWHVDARPSTLTFLLGSYAMPQASPKIPSYSFHGGYLCHRAIIFLIYQRSKEFSLEQLRGGIFVGFSGDIRGARGAVAPNNFRLPECDALFIRSCLQEAINNKVQASIVVSNYLSRLCRTGIRAAYRQGRHSSGMMAKLWRRCFLYCS